MNPEPLIAFAKEAETTMRTIRGGLLVCRQNGSTADLESQFRGVRTLRESAAWLGLRAVATVLDALDRESSRMFAMQAPLTDQRTRLLLDLLAHAEAEVLNVCMPEYRPMNGSGFLDNSSGFSQPEVVPEVQVVEVVPEAEAVDAETESPEDEFEIDAEMLEIFSMEAEDLLGNIETNLDLLVAAPANRDALWEIRRNAHTFKGAAGIVGLKKPSKLAHRVEDLLDYLAQNEIAPDEKILDLLTLSTNCLRSITSGDTSSAMMTRMNRVYSVFDDVMADIMNPAPAVAETVEVAENIAPVEAVPEVQLIVPAENIQTAESQTEAQPIPARPIVRVSITRLDELVRIVRDLVVSRSIVDQRMWEFEQQIEELHSTTRRLQSTSAKIETDFEASMLGSQPMLSFGWTNQPAGYEPAAGGEQFDSLEMDRYTDFHQTARELSEATSDSFSINTALEAVKGSLETVFEDQRRLMEEMQEKVMQIRLIRFGSLTTRLQRAVSVTCEEEHKLAEVIVENEEVELDTDVLDSMVEPLMHLIRNAVVHGIESPETRRVLGKGEVGRVTVRLVNEETHIVLRVSDDGRGISGPILREKAVSCGLIDTATAEALNSKEMLDLMFLPGLTTAERLSMSAGRGVGMSIVKNSIESRKGTIALETSPQKGTTFTVRIPLAYAVAQVLLVRSDRQTLAIPLKAVKHVSEFGPGDIKRDGDERVVEFESGKYALRFLAEHISAGKQSQPNGDYSNTLLIETEGTRCALVVDEILKTEEIAIKPLGKPLENLNGTLGAAVLGSGEIVPILDLQYLLNNKPQIDDTAIQEPESRKRRVLIVDDSPSVRHMTSKVIVSAGWEAVTAKDGVDAMELLHSGAELPDVVLTDVEMPRMDGYELVAAVRASELLHQIPMVMITSRAGDKHREKALDLGVSDYLAKPYDDSELISIVERLSTKDQVTEVQNIPVAPFMSNDVEVMDFH